MKSKNLQVVCSYVPESACVFRKVKEEFGGLSNMSNDFKVKVNGMLIYNTEALYQACRYPHLPDVQKNHSGSEKRNGGEDA